MRAPTANGSKGSRAATASTGGSSSSAGSIRSELAALYARCGGVFYAPVDEDFGMVPYEAFLSEKPVVTTTDAGGPLEVVADRRTGIVCEPRAAELAEACAWLLGHTDEARAWGLAGKEIARDRVVGPGDRAAARRPGAPGGMRPREHDPAAP